MQIVYDMMKYTAGKSEIIFKVKSIGEPVKWFLSILPRQ